MSAVCERGVRHAGSRFDKIKSVRRRAYALTVVRGAHISVKASALVWYVLIIFLLAKYRQWWRRQLATLCGLMWFGQYRPKTFTFQQSILRSEPIKSVPRRCWSHSWLGRMISRTNSWERARRPRRICPCVLWVCEPVQLLWSVVCGVYLGNGSRTS